MPTVEKLFRQSEHPVVRVHFNMMNAVFRMNRSQSGGNQCFQNVLGNLLLGAVHLAAVVERTADPERRSMGRIERHSLQIDAEYSR